MWGDLILKDMRKVKVSEDDTSYVKGYGGRHEIVDSKNEEEEEKEKVDKYCIFIRLFQ